MDVAYCVDGCGRPASGERLVGMCGGDVVVELVCEWHAGPVVVVDVHVPVSAAVPPAADAQGERSSVHVDQDARAVIWPPATPAARASTST